MLYMKQTILGLRQASKRTWRPVFLEEMDRVVLTSPLMLEGPPPFTAEVMLRIQFMQQWFNLGNPVIEEALHDMVLFRAFAVPDLSGVNADLPQTRLLRQHFWP
jgi:IS5 family transposase